MKSLPINHSPRTRLLAFIIAYCEEYAIVRLEGDSVKISRGVNLPTLSAADTLTLQRTVKSIVEDALDSDSVGRGLEIGMLLAKHGLAFTESDHQLLNDYSMGKLLLTEALVFVESSEKLL